MHIQSQSIHLPSPISGAMYFSYELRCFFADQDLTIPSRALFIINLANILTLRVRHTVYTSLPILNLYIQFRSLLRFVAMHSLFPIFIFTAYCRSTRSPQTQPLLRTTTTTYTNVFVWVILALMSSHSPGADCRCLGSPPPSFPVSC